MNTNRVLLLLITTAALAAQTALSATLTFDSAIPGTITDSVGLGSGFTHRLPGTGGSLPHNDPNIKLQTGSGLLTLQSTRADINHRVNLGELEAPGFFLPSVAATDVSISALFRDVRVPNGSDQLMLYFGTSATNVLRAGVHQDYVYGCITNAGNVDDWVWSSAANSFTPGDNIMMTLSRTAGLWQLTWQNITTSTSGSSPTFSLPWLDASPDLYAGVLASSPSSGTFSGNIDSITVVPGPPPLLTIGVSQVRVCWDSESDAQYQVQYRSDLTTNLWTDLGAALPGTGTTICILDAVLGQERRFYRVIETP